MIQPNILSCYSRENFKKEMQSFYSSYVGEAPSFSLQGIRKGYFLCQRNNKRAPVRNFTGFVRYKLLLEQVKKDFCLLVQVLKI